MGKYSVTTNGELRRLCIEKNWFTCGSNRQYEKMFDMNVQGASVEEIATVIWLCSDEEHTKSSILEELKAEHEEYLLFLAERRIAQGERDADEVYCGYFD